MILFGRRVRIDIEMTMNKIYINVNPKVKDHFKKKLFNYQLCMTSKVVSMYDIKRDLLGKLIYLIKSTLLWTIHSSHLLSYLCSFIYNLNNIFYSNLGLFSTIYMSINL